MAMITPGHNTAKDNTKVKQTQKANLKYCFTCYTEQVFDFLVVLDFESTCWEGQPWALKPEIIEFPAVLLSLLSGKVVAEFQQYVKPQEHPVLTPFCTNLTGTKPLLLNKSSRHTKLPKFLFCNSLS